jgi:hypothetical protein
MKGSATVGGPNGHRSNGLEIEGRPDPRLKAGVPDGVPDGVARRGGQTGPDGVPDRARRGATSSATSFFDCHIIGHVIFECHVTCLGWQGVILLLTLVSQR